MVITRLVVTAVVIKAEHSAPITNEGRLEVPLWEATNVFFLSGFGLLIVNLSSSYHSVPA
jgi:hypothetical protein